MFVRTRRQQKEAGQYEKLDHEHEFVTVNEGPYKFLVNFTDYLDTGLFLDHRLTRQRIGAMATGKRFLNLFAYTGSASVYAAGGGAVASTTVDMSNTYLDWAKRNMFINKLAGPEHGFVREDVLKWLNDQIAKPSASDLQSPASSPQPKRFDLIFVDPPTFSRSKRMEDTFEVQRDHVKLLKLVGQLLVPGGAIVFSNNFTKFKLDREALGEFSIEDISKATLPKDFERNPKIHCCFVLTRV
jgi:23S rRNA (guanine2445-N2)-methyltransferase / 23S rRNA (guanine2069-N7)-methyltransferase